MTIPLRLHPAWTSAGWPDTSGFRSGRWIAPTRWGCCLARTWSWADPRGGRRTQSRDGCGLAHVYLVGRGGKMTTPLELIVGKLRAGSWDPVETGRDSYESRCPVHRGSRRNLSIGVGKDGRVLLHCHHVDSAGTSGCGPEAIVGA